jgi:hypothetical protein
MEAPKTVRWLLWELVKHIWYRRGGDEVFVVINWDGGIATGAVTDFSWTGDDDAFCTIGADHDAFFAIDEVTP